MFSRGSTIDPEPHPLLCPALTDLFSFFPQLFIPDSNPINGKQVVNHGINKSVTSGALKAASDFFQLPAEKKSEFESNDLTKPVRYEGALQGDNNKSRILLKHYANPLKEWIPFWPQNPPAHSDYGFITIILQTCGGLQISHNNGDSWQPVHIMPGTLHVHLGDYMEVFSNGRYRSLVHRAVLGCEERISIASIHGYSMDEKVRAPKELVDEQHPKRYQESSFRDFLEFISDICNIGGKSFIQSVRIA